MFYFAARMNIRVFITALCSIYCTVCRKNKASVKSRVVKLDCFHIENKKKRLIRD